jgi:hypothetical protein
LVVRFSLRWRFGVDFEVEIAERSHQSAEQLRQDRFQPDRCSNPVTNASSYQEEGESALEVYCPSKRGLTVSEPMEPEGLKGDILLFKKQNVPFQPKRNSRHREQELPIRLSAAESSQIDLLQESNQAAEYIVNDIISLGLR